MWHTIKSGTPGHGTTKHGTPEHPGTVAEQLNITRNTSGTPRNNEIIQNEGHL